MWRFLAEAAYRVSRGKRQTGTSGPLKTTKGEKQTPYFIKGRGLLRFGGCRPSRRQHTGEYRQRLDRGSVGVVVTIVRSVVAGYRR